jgi:hypothetical protein
MVSSDKKSSQKSSETAVLLTDLEIEDHALGEDHKIGWFSAMCMVVGLMIGSGIFSTPSSVLLSVQSTGMALLLWLIGGVVALFGTLYVFLSPTNQ